MVIVKFPDEEKQKKALGFLIGRYSGHSWATGELLIPEEALVAMAREGLHFSIEGGVTPERLRALKDTPLSH